MTYKSYSSGFGSFPNSIPKDSENKNYRTGEVTQLRRIADSLEEILRLVKKDMEDNKKRWEYKPEEKDE